MVLYDKRNPLGNMVHLLRLCLCFAPALNLAVILTVVLLSPLSLSTQISSFSLALDLDDSEGDQAVHSLAVSPNQDVSIQIFGIDIQGAIGLFARFEYGATQVVYKGFDVGDVLPYAQALFEQDATSVQVNIASLGGSATVNTGLIGTLRFRTTDAFSGTEIWLVGAELGGAEQSETVNLSLSVVLQAVASLSPDFDGSGTVDIPDFLLFVDAFGSKEGQAQYGSRYDLDGDGEIGVGDFLIFIDSFGKVVNQTPVSNGTTTSTSGICTRTSQVQTAILSVIGGVDNCALVTDEHLAGIADFLNLRDQSITALRANDFSGLSNLEILNLYDNDLTALPADVFSGLSNLKFLSLDNNGLTALPADVFSGLSNLKFLSLNSNALSELPMGVFSGLSNLETLGLIDIDKNIGNNNGGLTALPDGVFSGLSSLSFLDVSGNMGAPFTLTLVLKRTDTEDLTAVGPATVVVKVAQGAPFDMIVSLSATGGTLRDEGGNTITEAIISKGSIESESIKVTQNGITPVTLSMGSAPAPPTTYTGLRTTAGTPLNLFR